MCGLNRVTESSGKELLIAQISESQCCQDLDTCALLATPTKRSKVKRISEKVHKLHHIHIKEMLIRRWVPSQERHNNSNQQQQD